MGFRSRLVLTYGILMLGSGLAARPAGAQTQTGGGPPPTLADEGAFSPDSAFAETLRRMEGEHLALGKAVEAALRSAPDMREAEAALASARAAVTRERGKFDPELNGEAYRSGSDERGSSPFAGADILKTRRTVVNAGALWRLPFGTELGASLNSTRLLTNSTFATLSPQYNTIGQLTIRQPLLKGFGPSARVDLSASERDFDAARARRDDALLRVRSEVETLYWDLYASERDLAVQVLIRDRARALLDEAQLRSNAGLIGPGQVATARVFLAEQEQAVLDQQDRLDAVSDQLASLISQRPEGGAPRFLSADAPPRNFEVEAADTLVARALRGNLELRAQERQVESLQQREKGAKWDALPALDLFGAVGGNSLAGTSREVIFGNDTLRTNITGGFGDTWSQVLARDYPTWSAGVRLSVPIGFREGRGERNRWHAEAERARQRLEMSRRTLEEDVRTNQRELAGGTRRLEFARTGVEASFEQVRIGMLEYRAGRTTAFELVRLSADLAAAQQRYSEALVRTARAAAALRRLTAEGFPASGMLEEDNRP